MNITIDFEYTENFIPKRCRKPRPALFQGKYDVEIRETTKEKAPIAIIEHDKSPMGKNMKIDYRWFDGQLYVRYDKTSWDRRSNNPTYQYNTPDSEGYCRSYWYANYSLEENKSYIEEWAKKFLYIDGILYYIHGEPRYVVMTFGLGCNHGGTALMTSYDYNPNIRHDAYFPISKREEAIKSAKETALGRGDNKSVPIKVWNKYDILIPEAIQIQPDIQHGDGDPFINRIEGVISAVQNPLCVGFSLLTDMASHVDAASGNGRAMGGIMFGNTLGE